MNNNKSRWRTTNTSITRTTPINMYQRTCHDCYYTTIISAITVTINSTMITVNTVITVLPTPNFDSKYFNHCDYQLHYDHYQHHIQIHQRFYQLLTLTPNTTIIVTTNYTMITINTTFNTVINDSTNYSLRILPVLALFSLLSTPQLLLSTPQSILSSIVYQLQPSTPTFTSTISITTKSTMITYYQHHNQYCH